MTSMANLARLLALSLLLSIGAAAADASKPASGDAAATALADQQMRRQDQVLRRVDELAQAGARGEAVTVLEQHLARYPNDELVRQALLNEQIAALETEIRGKLDSQARTQDLIIGDPNYEAARERAAEEVQKRLATVEYFVAQHHYPQAVDACDAILRDHPGHPAVLTIKLNILRMLEKAVKDERVALLREQQVRHDESMDDAIARDMQPHEKETQARTVLIFAEDVAEAERQRMRAKLQDRIDLIQDNVEVGKVLETLFAVSGINYMVVDSAIGDERLTIHQVQASVDEVLSIIAKQVNLRFNYEGGSVYVTSGDSEVMTTEIIRIESGLTNVGANPKLSELSMPAGSANGGAGGTPGAAGNAFDAFAAAGGGGGGGGEEGGNGGGKSDLEKFLDKIAAGKIIVGWPADGDIYLDKKSNTVYVRSTPSAIAELKRLLHAMDYNSVQILIEARFVEVTETAMRTLGTSFASQGESPNSQYQYGGSSNAQGIGLPPTNAPGAPNEGFAAVLTSQNVKGFPDFRVALQALEKEGQADTLSEPKILTLNNATGVIKLTQDVSYIESFQTQSQTTQSAVTTGTVVSASSTVLVPQLGVAQDGIELHIVPSVARNADIITLDITPTVKQMTRLRQQPFAYQPAPGSGQIATNIEKPEFDTRTLHTSLHVQNGQTVVLGGLIKEKKQRDSSGVPFLSRIPVLGYLFSTKSKSLDRRHLLIFVTAHIIDPNGAKLDDRLRVLRDTARVVLPTDAAEQVRQYGAAPARDEAAPANAPAKPATNANAVRQPWERGGRAR